MSDYGLTHIALPVKSIDLSIAFYAKFANMEVVHRRGGVAWVSNRTRPFAIVLMQSDEEVSPLRPEAHIGIALRSKEDVDSLFETARSEGLVVREPDQYPSPIGYWGYIRDPDGHTLELSYGQKVEFAVHNGGV